MDCGSRIVAGGLLLALGSVAFGGVASGVAVSAVNPATGNIYYMSNAAMTWPEAGAWATGLGGYLAAIGDQSEQEWLVQSLLPSATDGGAWIGLRQALGGVEPDGGWEWSNGQPVTFTNWQPGKPDNGDTSGDEDYAVMQSPPHIDGEWDDKRGTRLWQAIAEVPASGPQQGLAMRFGGDDWLSIDHGGELTFDLDEDSFTVELWVRPFDTGETESVYQDRFSQESTPYNLVIRNSIRTWVANSWYSSSNYDFANLSAEGSAAVGWQHVAVVYDAGTREKTMYVNGQLVSVESAPMETFVPNSDGVLVVGGGWYPSEQPGNFFNGLMDDLRIWSTARNQSELRAAMHAQLIGDESGLEAMYTFEEGSGQTVLDRSGNGHHGRRGAGDAADSADPAWTGWDGSGCAPADLAVPFGVLDLSDVTAFINSFTQGCP